MRSLVYNFEKFGKISVSHVTTTNPENSWWSFIDEGGNIINADERWDDDINHPPLEAQVLGWLVAGEVIARGSGV